MQVEARKYLMKVPNSLKNRGMTFWKILPPILTIIGIFVSLWVSGVFVTKGKHLKIEATRQKVLVNIVKSVAPNVSATYKGKEIEDLRLIQVKITNTGSEPIFGRASRGDVRQPLRFYFSQPGAKFLEKARVNENPQGVKIKQKLVENRKRLVVEFDWLNEKNYFSLNILYSASCPVLPEVAGKIAGIKQKDLTTLKKTGQAAQKHRKGTGIPRFFLILLISVLIGGLVFIGILWHFSFNEDKVKVEE